jgi:hypothetical protein
MLLIEQAFRRQRGLELFILLLQQTFARRLHALTMI